MSDEPQGPPSAFPFAIIENGSTTSSYSLGMDLRDWFAGQALAGILAFQTKPTTGEVATAAYGIADAMLRERQS